VVFVQTTSEPAANSCFHKHNRSVLNNWKSHQCTNSVYKLADVARLFLSYGLGIVLDWKTKVLVTPPPMHDSDYNDVVRILVGHS